MRMNLILLGLALAVFSVLSGTYWYRMGKQDGMESARPRSWIISGEDDCWIVSVDSRMIPAGHILFEIECLTVEGAD